MHGLWMAWRGAFQQLYGMLHVAVTHVGMSPDCSKLGLGVVDAGTQCAASATRLFSVTPVYVCKNLHSMGYPNKTWDNPVSTTYPDISRISKNSTKTNGISQENSQLNKTDRISQDDLTCDLSLDIPWQVLLYQLIPACSFSSLEKQLAGVM